MFHREKLSLEFRFQKSQTTELETMQLKVDHAKFAFLKKCEHWADKSNKVSYSSFQLHSCHVRLQLIFSSLLKIYLKLLPHWNLNMHDLSKTRRENLYSVIGISVLKLWSNFRFCPTVVAYVSNIAHNVLDFSVCLIVYFQFFKDLIIQ
jgi:hypothetical protein